MAPRSSARMMMRVGFEGHLRAAVRPGLNQSTRSMSSPPRASPPIGWASSARFSGWMFGPRKLETTLRIGIDLARRGRSPRELPAGAAVRKSSSHSTKPPGKHQTPGRKLWALGERAGTCRPATIRRLTVGYGFMNRTKPQLVHRGRWCSSYCTSSIALPQRGQKRIEAARSVDDWWSYFEKTCRGSIRRGGGPARRSFSTIGGSFVSSASMSARVFSRPRVMRRLPGRCRPAAHRGQDVGGLERAGRCRRSRCWPRCR